ncbi:MAG: hypothetical protein DHS20C12_30070 [Pseudohongiella sp.]|nr:MAG: hypothetical protein DHS20C12_30070 [Pseudohongiella sp.]
MRVKSLYSKITAAICATTALLVALSGSVAVADTYQRGQHVEPAFEGWRPNDDGTFSMMFGYMNLNWSEEPNVPVGEHNNFGPGEADRGQPTHFLPRRNRFTFEVEVPSDWGDRELVWTLNVNGVERKAYATLKPDYLVDNIVIASETGSLGAGTSSPESRSNVKPDISVIGDRIRTVRVGEPMQLRTQVTDDGIPTPSDPAAEILAFATASAGGFASAFITEEAIYNMRLAMPPIKVTVNKVNGLFLSWNVYRGEGNVTFDPPLPKPWEDTRTSANSPWGALWTAPPIPEDGIYETSVTFDEPGTYVLWGRADDGGLYNDDYITVNVTE